MLVKGVTFPLLSVSSGKNVSFFIYEDTSLKLAILIYYDIPRNISGRVILKNVIFF